MDKSHILLQAYGNLLLQVCSFSLLSDTMALNAHIPSLSSVTLTVSFSLVSFRDCPNVANASCFLLLEEILASNASLAVIPPTPTVALPSLRCLEVQLCRPPIHVSPLLRALPRVLYHVVL